VKACKDELLIVALYEMILSSWVTTLIDELKREMKLEFGMTDLEMMRYFLGFYL
jgi:hypothetical protein